MRVLLLGGSGQLGRALRAAAPTGLELLAPGRDRLDLSDPAPIAAFVRDAAPELLVNAAAWTDVDRAESEPAAAFAVNAAAVGALAAATAAVGARLVHVSTDHVFDGERGRPYPVEAPVSPVNAYGASKRRGEELALEALGARAAIVRTSWLHGPRARGFVSAILARLRDRGEAEVVADQIGVPTHAAGLATAIWRLARRPEIGGILHWTDAGVASRYDQAVAIAEEAQAAGMLRGGWTIRPSLTADRPAPARRPPCVVLDATGTRAALGVEPPHWRDGIRRTLLEDRDGA